MVCIWFYRGAHIVFCKNLFYLFSLSLFLFFFPLAIFLIFFFFSFEKSRVGPNFRVGRVTPIQHFFCLTYHQVLILQLTCFCINCQEKKKNHHLRYHLTMPHFNFLGSDHASWFGHGFINCLAWKFLFCPIHKKLIIWEIFWVSAQTDLVLSCTTFVYISLNVQEWISLFYSWYIATLNFKRVALDPLHVTCSGEISLFNIKWHFTEHWERCIVIWRG